MTPHNLADLPEAERERIEDDKRRCFQARKMLRNQTRDEIVAHLEALPEDEREDLRRRLNTIKQNRRKEWKPKR